jgi:hypothetical protein
VRDLLAESGCLFNRGVPVKVVSSPDGGSLTKFWLNGADSAHGGSAGDRDSACKAVFISMKTVAALNSRNLVDAKFPPGMRRQSRLMAAWTLNRPGWAPTPDAIETDEFD